MMQLYRISAEIPNAGSAHYISRSVYAGPCVAGVVPSGLAAYLQRWARDEGMTGTVKFEIHADSPTVVAADGTGTGPAMVCLAEWTVADFPTWSFDGHQLPGGTEGA